MCVVAASTLVASYQYNIIHSCSLSHSHTHAHTHTHTHTLSLSLSREMLESLLRHAAALLRASMLSGCSHIIRIVLLVSVVKL